MQEMFRSCVPEPVTRPCCSEPKDPEGALLPACRVLFDPDFGCSRPEKCHAPSAEVYGNIGNVHPANRVNAVTLKKCVEGEYAVERNGRRGEGMNCFEAQVDCGQGGVISDALAKLSKDVGSEDSLRSRVRGASIPSS